MKTDKTKYFLNKFNPELAEVIIEMTIIINEVFSEEELGEKIQPPTESEFFFEDEDYLYFGNSGYYTVNENYLPLPSNERFVTLANKLGPVKLIDRKGGREGQGSDVRRVYHFQNWDLYISFEGEYQSYCGKEYLSCRKVKPVMVQTYSWPNA